MKTVAVTEFANPVTGFTGTVDIVDFAKPEVGPEGVLIKVAYCSICGSDPHIMALGGALGMEPPKGLGHEVSGVIAELGAEATTKGLKVGDRVAGNYYKACGKCPDCLNGRPNMCLNMFKPDGMPPGMAEYVLWDEQQVFKIPDSLPLEEACLLEPTAIALRAIEKANIPVGGTVAISGAGAIGLLLVQMAKMCGASTVTIIEPVEDKLALAKELGADFAINPKTDDVVAEAMKITGGVGFNSVIESSGAPAACKPALDVLAKAGTVVYFAMYPIDYEMPLNLFATTYWKELTITGFFNSPFSFDRALAMLPRLNLKPFIEHIFPIDDAKAAFELQATGKPAKVIIKCS